MSKLNNFLLQFGTDKFMHFVVGLGSICTRHQGTNVGVNYSHFMNLTIIDKLLKILRHLLPPIIRTTPNHFFQKKMNKKSFLAYFLLLTKKAPKSSASFTIIYIQRPTEAVRELTASTGQPAPTLMSLPAPGSVALIAQMSLLQSRRQQYGPLTAQSASIPWIGYRCYG